MRHLNLLKSTQICGEQQCDVSNPFEARPDKAAAATLGSCPETSAEPEQQSSNAGDGTELPVSVEDIVVSQELPGHQLKHS